MTAPAWMPLYVADYLGDTGHLSTVEHGAYMLLIMHYWQNGGLPTEDPKLARICRLSLKEWQKIKDTLSDLFDDNWTHKRVNEELAKTIRALRPPPREWRIIRQRIFARDNYTCSYCGMRGGPLECDHITPIARGGSNHDGNLTTACRPCNQSKSDRTVEEWRHG